MMKIMLVKSHHLFFSILASVAILLAAATGNVVHSGNPIACAPPPLGMVAWYPGDGNANDIQAGNNGTLLNGAAFGSGKVGPAFSFDGIDDVVSVPSSSASSVSGTFTVDAWISLTSYSSLAPIISKWNDIGINKRSYFLAVQSDGRVRFTISPDGAGFSNSVSTAVVPLNTLTHVAGVFDSSSQLLSVYVNGVQSGMTVVSSSVIFTSDEPLLIGAGDLGGSTRLFTNGLIDEVEIFNRALSQTEIQAIFNADSSGKCKPSARAGRATYDFDGDGKTDVAYWNPTNHNWYVQQSMTSTLRTQLDWGNGSLGDIAVPRDYDGDFKTDIAVYRPSEGNWYIIQSNTNTIRLVNWGLSSDKPVPADYDGDGKTDIAVYRPAEGNWYILNSATNTGTVRGWGNSSDIPVPGFYDADARADIAVYRPAEGNWYILNSLSNTARIVNWGGGADTPVLADFDGDGRTDITVFRPNGRVWYINQSGGGVTIKHWGDVGDKLVPGDYDGDGKADIAVFRPSQSAWWIIQSGTNTLANPQFGFGGTSDVPAPSTFIP